MIKVKFFGDVDSQKDYDNLKATVVDSFQEFYDYEFEDQKNEDDEFEIIFKGDWSSPDDIDEDIIRDICDQNEIYCSVLIDDKTNKTYYYDEDYEFIYE